MKPAIATDAQYLAAVKSGSVEWAQQMVDAAANAAGYTVVGYHGTKKEFTSFNSNFNKESPFSNGKKPWFFSENEETASTYGSNINNYLLKLKNPLEIHEITGRDSDGEYQREAFMLENEYQALPENIRLLFEEAKNSDADTDFIVQEMLKSGNAVSDYRKAFKKWGKDNDGIIAYETLDTLGEEYIDNIFIVFDPSQIKLADPITYDKSGKVIPLSKRFNSSSEEITNPVVPENEGIPFFHTTTKITKLEDVDISKTSPNSYLGQALYGVLEGGSWKPSHLKSGRILRGTVSGRIIDLSNVTNEDLKRIGQLIGRNIETVPFLTLEKRYGDIGKGLRAAGYSAAIHLGPANTGKHIAIFDVSKIKSIGVDEITNPAGRIPAQFPYEYASYLKQHFPEIWRLGGNIRGNDAFRWWSAYRQGDLSPTVMHWWSVTRPAWIARHYRDHLIAGVVAQIKWGTIGRLGVAGMKRVVETKIRNSR
jgi:hypothetical protein